MTISLTATTAQVNMAETNRARHAVGSVCAGIHPNSASLGMPIRADKGLGFSVVHTAEQKYHRPLEAVAGGIRDHIVTDIAL